MGEKHSLIFEETNKLVAQIAQTHYYEKKKRYSGKV